MDFNKLKNKVYNALKKQKVKCYIKRETEKIYNEETNEYESVEEIINGYAIVSAIDIKNIDNTLIKVGDVQIMCVLDKPPLMNEKIIINDKEYTIININPFSPDSLNVIYYDLQAR
jgi:hypothetical protein